MKKTTSKNQLIIDENVKPNKTKAVKKSKKPIIVENEYSDPSDLDFSIDLEPDVAITVEKSISAPEEDESKSTLDEFKPFILINLLDTESDFLPLETELVIKNKHRFALVDWLFRIHREFMFSDDTLYSAIDLFDRIYKARKIRRCHYQLFAATALWIASKLEETQTPALSDFIYLCEDAYVENEFIECEKAFCLSLGFNLYGPTARSYVLAITSSEKHQYLTPIAEFYLKFAVFSELYPTEVPSQVAIACIYLAILTTNSDMSCIEENSELSGLDIKSICKFTTSIIEMYHTIMGGTTSPELRTIFLKEMPKLQVSIPVFDDKFLARIKQTDLISVI